MSFTISVSARNVSQKPVTGASVSIGSSSLTTDASGQTTSVTGAATQKVSIDHPDYVSASSTVTVADDQKGGLTVTSDPLQVSSTQWYPAGGGNFTVQVWFTLGQLQDVPGYNARDYFFIKSPWKMRTPASSNNVLGTVVAGWDRFLNSSFSSTLASQGQYMAARWKNKSGSYSPQLVSMWVPTACVPELKNGKQHGGPSYLLYFTPKIPAEVTDSYPDGEFYRKLGDRYLFSEMMTAHHMLAQGRHGIIVVPIGQAGQSFSDIASRSGALRLLREVSHYVRRKSSVDIATQFIQDVFAVAVAGFSDGGNPLYNVLTATGGDVDAEYFYTRALREVYHLDCDPSSTSAYVSAILSWYGNTTGAKGLRNYRVYTAKSWASSLGGFSTAHSVGGASENHDPSRSFVSVGGGYIQPVLDAMNAAKRAGTLDVENNIPANPHHFFPYFFVGHAIGHSDIF